MALPTTIDPTAPLGSAAVSDGDAQLRAFKQAIVDFFGVPADPTSLTAAAFSISAAGVVTFISAPDMGISAPATPTANRAYRDSIVKGWVTFDATGAIGDDLNVSSVTDTAAGDWTVNWATAFTSAAYVVAVGLNHNQATASLAAYLITVLAGSTRVQVGNEAETLADPNTNVFVIAIGDQ